MNIRLKYLIVVLAAVVACMPEEQIGPGNPLDSSRELFPMTITATLDKSTKASMQTGDDFGKVYWESGDSLAVIALHEDGSSSLHAFGTDDEGPVAEFSNKKGVPLASDYYGIYPYFSPDVHKYVNRGSTNSGYDHGVSQNGEVSLVRHSSQRSSAGALKDFNALSVGKVEADGRTLSMKNIGGLIALNIRDTDITSVTMYGNSGEILSGTFTTVLDSDGIPQITSVEGSNMVRIVPSGDSCFAAGTYYMNVPSVVFESGLTLLFTNSSSKFAVLSSRDRFEVRRSQISRLPDVDLNFTGTVVDLVFISDAGKFFRSSFSNGTTANLPGGDAAQKKLGGTIQHYTCNVNDETMTFAISATNSIGANSGTCRGLLFGSTQGDYIEIPPLSGHALTRVVMRNGSLNKASGNPAIVSASDNSLIAESWVGGAKVQGMEHVWSFDGEPGEAYRMTLMNNSLCQIQQLRLFYSPADGGAVVSFNMFNSAGGFSWPFASPASGVVSNLSSSPSHVGETIELKLKEDAGNHVFTVYASGGINKNSGSGQGLRIHGTGSGDYLLFPSVEGRYLTKVEVETGAAGNMRGAVITTADGESVVSGGNAITGEFTERGQIHVWRLAETEAGQRYRMSFNSSGTASIRSLKLIFSKKPLSASESEEIWYPEQEDVIPDFSRVGYRWSDKAIPSYDVVTTIEAPSDGSDATELIQNAIDAMTGQGAILLKAGTYNVSGKININKSGVVLRGEGKSTVIRATGVREPEKENLLTLGLAGTSRQNIMLAQSEIMTPRLAVGQMRIPVREPWKFSAGDRVVIWRPGTAQWISDLKMDQIPQNSSNSVVQWNPADFNLTWERTVMSVKGDYVYLDNPVVMETSLEYGGGILMRCSWERISESGIEDMHLDTEYNEDEVDEKGRLCDEDHAWSAVIVRAAEHCWVRNVSSSHFAFSTVHLNAGAKNITVEDCHGHEPVSQIAGSRRYAFQMAGAQLCIVKDCTCENDRHAFATSHNKTCGPNVFLRCSATNMFGDLGPHVKWSSGVLYDNVTTDSCYIAVQDRHNAGNGHGWAGVTFVLYNCTAPKIICQNPWVTGKNYAIGCVGEKTSHNRTGAGVDASFSRPDGVWIDHGAHVTPESLYESTLEKRHTEGIYIAN